MLHHLKIRPLFFEAVMDGSKTFEVRNNDREFQPNDYVVLREWTIEGGYTGRQRSFVIGFVLPLVDGQVVFSLLQSNDGRQVVSPEEAVVPRAFP